MRCSSGGTTSSGSLRRREMPPHRWKWCGHGHRRVARLQRGLQFAVGAHVHHVAATLHLRVLVIAQVERGDANRRAGAPAHHAHLALHAVVHRLARAHQVQFLREMEGELVIGKMVPAGRIPVAARAHVEHMIARLVDHFAGMAELELVFAPRVQRLRRRHQHLIVAPAHQIQPRAFGLQHLRRHAVHQHFRHRHLPRNIERHRGQRRGIHLHLDACRHVQREVRRHRGIDAVIAYLRVADLRCRDSCARIATGNWSRCRNTDGPAGWSVAPP